MRPVPKLPIKFILLWIVNLAVILTVALTTDVHQWLLHHLRLTDVAWIYLAVGAVLAALEQALFDKLRGE